MQPPRATDESGPGAGATARRAYEPRQLSREVESVMNDTCRTTTNGPALVYVMRAFWLIVGEHLAASAMTFDEVALMLGERGERLREYIADPLETPARYLVAFTTMFDLRASELWEQANERGRLIERQVVDGVACHRCGRAFRVGSTLSPDGFGEHGQLFRCSGEFGCAESGR
ncbi:hypothetical protein [Nocardia cyriacigeorgica]|nr:hypothetical protein [Nocardia cyriacigeorgica]